MIFRLFKAVNVSMVMFLFHPSIARADTWSDSRTLYNYLKKACKYSYTVEEAVTNSDGGVQKDQNGKVLTRFVTKSEIRRSCVPSKFPNLYLSTYATFKEVDKNTFGSDYIIFDSGPVDLKCIVNRSTAESWENVEEGTGRRISGTVVEWRFGLIDDDFVMNCD